MNTDKNSLFVFVEDADVENFVSNYVDGEEIFGQTDIYNNKIAFLGSSGKIATHRWIYGSGQQVIKFTVKNSLTNITSSNNSTVIVLIYLEPYSIIVASLDNVTLFSEFFTVYFITCCPESYIHLRVAILPVLPKKAILLL